MVCASFTILPASGVPALAAPGGLLSLLYRRRECNATRLTSAQPGRRRSLRSHFSLRQDEHRGGIRGNHSAGPIFHRRPPAQFERAADGLPVGLFGIAMPRPPGHGFTGFRPGVEVNAAAGQDVAVRPLLETIGMQRPP